MTELCAPVASGCMRRSTSVGAVLDKENLTRPSSLYEVFKALKEKECAENLTDQEIESKFVSLSLAFKTDKLTLTNRLDLQQRQRDLAEKNIGEEIKHLKSGIEALSSHFMDVETRNSVRKILQQVEVLRHAADRVSSSAEVYGAVQQEARISRAIDIMLLHVDNMKKIHDREHSELEESKKILSQHNLPFDNKCRAVAILDSRPNHNRVRSISVFNHSNANSQIHSNNHLTAPTLDSGKFRRASMAAQPISKTSESGSHHTSSLSPTAPKPTRRVGIVESNFQKSLNPPGHHLASGQSPESSPGTKDSVDLIVRSNQVSSRVETDDRNNNLTNLDPVKSDSNCTNTNDHVPSRPKFRSRSLIEPVQEEDESSLLDEIDELARKRDSSPAPPSMRDPVKIVRQISLYKRFLMWYRELYWPYNWEDTILRIRYFLTGLLLFAAFVSLVVTIFGSQHANHKEL